MSPTLADLQTCSSELGEQLDVSSRLCGEPLLGEQSISGNKGSHNSACGAVRSELRVGPMPVSLELITGIFRRPLHSLFQEVHAAVMKNDRRPLQGKHGLALSARA